MDSAKLSETPEIKLHFLDYWRIIRLRKSLILTVFLLVVTTTTALTLFVLPEKFGSMVRMLVEQDAPDVAVSESPYVHQQFNPFFIETQMRIIESSSILYEVIKELKLDEKFGQQLGVGTLSRDKAYEQLRKQMKVRDTRMNSLIEVWVYSTDKQLAADIANTVARVYQKSRENKWKETRTAGVNKLKEQLATQEQNVAAEEKALSDLRTSLNIPDMEDNGPFATSTLNNDKLRSLERSRSDAENDYIQYKNILIAVTNLSRVELKRSLTTAYPNPNDTTLSTLTLNLNEAQAKMVAAKQIYGEQNVEYKKAKDLLDLVENQINDKIDGIIRGLKTRVDYDYSRLKELQAAEDIALANLTKSAAEYAPYFNKKTSLENSRRNKGILSQQVLTQSIDAEQPQLSIVQVTSAAEPGSRPESPNKPLNIALGIIIGLMVGIGLAFFIEYLDTSVKTIDDVERALQAPVIGVIPQNVGVMLDEGEDSPHAEAYRVLRTNLLFSRKDESWKTISILSGGAGEGKSTTLLNLATVFAQNGQRVLIVDSDLRRPSIHKLLKLSNAVGLTDCLLKQKKIEEVIQKTQLPMLDCMASGKLPSSSMGILSSLQMKDMIQELKRRYDFVFFDSPPLLGVSDASILASEMDMVMQVIQYRRYPQLMTIRAKQMILKVGGNLIGIVLNNINMSSDENYYYYSGYYEYQTRSSDSTVVKLSEAAPKAEIKQKY